MANYGPAYESHGDDTLKRVLDTNARLIRRFLRHGTLSPVEYY